MVCGTAVEKSKASADERLANQPLSSTVSNCKHYHLGLRRADGRQFCNDCGSYLTESQLQCGHQNLAPDRTPDGRWRCSDCGFFVGTANNVATLSLSGAGSEIQGKVVETEFRDKTVIVIMGIVLGLLGIIAIVLTVLTHTNLGNPVLSIGDSPVAGYTVPDGYNKLLMICPNATRESKSVNEFADAIFSCFQAGTGGGAPYTKDQMAISLEPGNGLWSVLNQTFTDPKGDGVVEAIQNRLLEDAH
jgi:hypothetical protein